MTNPVFETAASVAYFILIASYFPQIYQLYKTKKSDQVNILFPALVLLSLWLMEPAMLTSNSLAIGGGNTASIIVSTIVLAEVIYYRYKPSGSRSVKDKYFPHRIKQHDTRIPGLCHLQRREWRGAPSGVDTRRSGRYAKSVSSQRPVHNHAARF